MKPQITIDRARIWIAVAALGLIALGSFWAESAFRQRGEDDAQKSSLRLEPDYYVEHFQLYTSIKYEQSKLPLNR